MIHILLLFSALLNNTFKSVRIHLETHGLVGIRFQFHTKSQISTPVVLSYAKGSEVNNCGVNNG